MYLHAGRMMEGLWANPEVRNLEWLLEVEMTLCKSGGMRAVMDVEAYKAVGLGLSGAVMAGVYFFHGFQLAASKCDGFGEQREYCERRSG